MRGAKTYGLLAACVLVAASAAMGSPIVDGSVGGGVEYAFFVPDALGPETGFDSNHLNIDTLWVDQDADANGFYYFGLTVVQPPIDSNGGDTSTVHRTTMSLDLADSLGGTSLYLLDLSIRPTQTELLLSDANNGFAPIALTGGDYAIAVGDALEFKVSKSKMPSLGDLVGRGFFAVLSDEGFANDDQLEGTLVGIPEPMTAVLLALGLPLLARRRRTA